jgi:hypothetical protein
MGVLYIAEFLYIKWSNSNGIQSPSQNCFYWPFCVERDPRCLYQRFQYSSREEGGTYTSPENVAMITGLHPLCNSYSYSIKLCFCCLRCFSIWLFPLCSTLGVWVSLMPNEISLNIAGYLMCGFIKVWSAILVHCFFHKTNIVQGAQ